MKKKQEVIQGLVAQRDPLEADREAMNLLAKGKSAEARAIVEEVASRDRKASRRLVSQAESS
jgi:hypothetical protein